MPGGVTQPLPPPPDSWASNAQSDLTIWTLRLAPGGQWVLPPAAGEGTRRKLYFFAVARITVDGQMVGVRHTIEVRAGAAITRVNDRRRGYR